MTVYTALMHMHRAVKTVYRKVPAFAIILSPRLLAEPWRQEERCVRAGENESPRRLSSAVSPVYSTRSNKHFDTTGTQHSFVHSTTMSLLYESPLRSLLETANQPDAASVGSLL